MKLTLQRLPSSETATIGTLHIDGTYACHTLEDVVREVEGQPVSEWKIHGQTAIPASTYRVSLEDSPRFGADTLTINDVPGFTGVRMHAGNTDADTEGCILLGLQATDHTLIGGTSRPAVQLVKHAVQQALAAGEYVEIEISPAEAVA